MSNIQCIRVRQFTAASLVVGFAAAWIVLEFHGSPLARAIAALCALGAGVHFGWRIEHDRTRWKRADATLVAFYGRELLARDGTARLMRVFEEFVAKGTSAKEFDGFGCTKLMLSEEVLKELSALGRERRNRRMVHNRNTASASGRGES